MKVSTRNSGEHNAANTNLTQVLQVKVCASIYIELVRVSGAIPRTILMSEILHLRRWKVVRAKEERT